MESIPHVVAGALCVALVALITILVYGKKPAAKAIKIIITKRADDFHARIEGEARAQGYGKSIDAAIGDLAWNYPEEFSIEIESNLHADLHP